MEYVPEDDGVDPPMPESPQQPTEATASDEANGEANGTA
jgi:hypothetical protein